MILVDTSVWIDHLRSPETKLTDLLHAGDVLMHPMVIGELACGNLHNRSQRLKDWAALPRIPELPHEEVTSLIETNGLIARGIGFIDAHLLCATLRHSGTSLWTRDSRLKLASESCGVAFQETA